LGILFASTLLNIGSLNAKYLSSLFLARPDKLFAVHTHYYANHPPGSPIYYACVWNWTVLAIISPTAAIQQVALPTTTHTTTVPA